MIQKLQRRFVLITMCCLSLIVFILIGMINVLNYVQMDAQNKNLLQILEEHDGSFPKGKRRQKHPDDQDRNSKDVHPGNSHKNFLLPFLSGRMSEETEYEIRYFTVRESGQGEKEMDLSHIAAISGENALAFVIRVENSGKTEGYLSHYRYLVSEREDSTLYIFLDCRNEITALRNHILLSLFAGLVLILMVLLPVLILSRRAMRPVQDSIIRQKQFVTDAGHELKTPLAIISANVEVLELCEEENEWTRSIKNQVERMNLLICNLLMLAKLDEMQEEEEIQNFLFGETVQKAAESFFVVASGKKVSIETDIDCSAVVKGNPSRLNQLIVILIDNAVKYTDQGGGIRIVCGLTDRQVILTVWNSCDPLPDHELSRLFDRFYRNDSSRSRQTGGYGIGLSAAQAIVKAHRGRITVENQAGGICFTVNLPRT